MTGPYLEDTKEVLTHHKGFFTISSHVENRKLNQANEELLQFQKEFASLIYMERDQNKWL